MRIAQGRRSAIEFIKSNVALAEEIEGEVRTAIRKKLSTHIREDEYFDETSTIVAFEEKTEDDTPDVSAM